MDTTCQLRQLPGSLLRPAIPQSGDMAITLLAAQVVWPGRVESILLNGDRITYIVWTGYHRLDHLLLHMPAFLNPIFQLHFFATDSAISGSHLIQMKTVVYITGMSTYDIKDSANRYILS